MKKYIAEFIGTFILVLVGCTVAVITGASIIPTSLAFGLCIIAISYSIGNISGCHINPAVSLSMLITKKINIKNFIGYVISQILGAILGAIVLGVLLGNFNTLGTNAYANNVLLADTEYIALLIEIILTFIFITTILGVTSKKEYTTVSGIVIGLTLTLLHLIGIPFTGASLNPARSLGPALIEGGKALNQVWMFILAPLIGSILASLFHKYILSNKNN